MISSNRAVDLQIIVNKLYTNITENNVRYNIATRADISIIAQAKQQQANKKTASQCTICKGFSARLMINYRCREQYSGIQY
ncbi:MAG: YajG family lipoprotein [Sodalis sp. (in: enterobacteria)]